MANLSKLTPSLIHKANKNFSFDSFTRDPEHKRKTSFVPSIMTLWEFLWKYRCEIMDVFDVCIDDDDRIEELYQIYVVVDISENNIKILLKHF